MQIFLPDDFAEVDVEAPDGTRVRRTKLGDSREWSHACHPAFKGTGDGASFQNAPVHQKSGTSCVLIYLGSGVRKASDWAGLVPRLAQSVHSCLRCFPIVAWMSKDNKVNLTEHVAPRMEQTRKIEKGITADLVSEMPPWDLTDGTLSKRELETEAGTKRNRGNARKRVTLVQRVAIFASFMWAFDGSTIFSASGVGVGSGHADPFSSETADDMGSFHLIAVLKKGRRLVDLAEELWPGCTSTDHPDHWRIEYRHQSAVRGCSTCRARIRSHFVRPRCEWRRWRGCCDAADGERRPRPHPRAS